MSGITVARRAVCAAALVLAAADVLEARLEDRRQVRAARRLGLLERAQHDLLPGRFALEHLHHAGGVLVVVIGGVELRRQRLHELLRHVDFPIRRRRSAAASGLFLAAFARAAAAGRGDAVDVFRELLDLTDVHDLVRVVHRLQAQRPALVRPNRAQVLLAAQHELGDGDLPARLHRPQQDPERLLPAGVRAEEVGFVEVDRVELAGVDELPHCDGPAGDRATVLQVLVRDDHVLVLADLEPLDDVLARHFFVFPRALHHLPHRRLVLVVQHAKRDALGAHRGVELDRHADRTAGQLDHRLPLRAGRGCCCGCGHYIDARRPRPRALGPDWIV